MDEYEDFEIRVFGPECYVDEWPRKIAVDEHFAASADRTMVDVSDRDICFTVTNARALYNKTGFDIERLITLYELVSVTPR